MQNFQVFIIAFITCLIATPIAIKIAPLIGAMDIPKDNRRMHAKPIPRFGGIAIFCGVLSAYVMLRPLNKQTIGLLVGASVIFLVGLVDDLVDMPAKLKLLGQVIAALIPCACGVRIYSITNYFSSDAHALFNFPFWLSVLVTIIWMVGITNTINLIDGLDGLSSGIVCIASLAVAYSASMSKETVITMFAFAVAGSCTAFLIFNFYPAKIFMGDAGAQFLGYMMAAIPLMGASTTKTTTLFSTLVPIVILALPIFDTAFSIVRRVANHMPIMQADKDHLHHRIMRLGFGQRRAVVALYCISALMGIAGVLWTSDLRWEAIILLGIALLLIVIFLGIGVVDKKPTEELEEKTDEQKN